MKKLTFCALFLIGLGWAAAEEKEAWARKQPEKKTFERERKPEAFYRSPKQQAVSLKKGVWKKRYPAWDAKIIRKLWASFSWEPSVREVQKAAIRYAYVQRRSVRSWKKRVRHAAWLPDVKVGVERSNGDESRIEGEPGTSTEWKEERGDDLSYGIQVKWSFDRLIFDPNELKVSREAQRLVELREEVVHGVTRVFFERRRLLVMGRLRPPRSLRSAVKRRLAKERLEGLLDAMTGGWYGKELKKRKRNLVAHGRKL